MQITKKFCALKLLQCCGLWATIVVFALCHTSMAEESAEIISGRPKIIYDIKSLSGEPNYKSVNLTWEIEEVLADGGGGEPESAEAPLPEPAAFQVFYCEMQAWGSQRCKSKLLKPTEENHLDSGDHRSGREFSLVIDNLRMATKYSFHVRQLIAGGAESKQPKGRGIDTEISMNDLEKGQSIIIPTKGFAAHATKCLAHASEIEVETGPFFGGKIMVENSDCIIEGNSESPQDTYVMQIDHHRCGSQVFHNNLTVVTTVVTQENQGIFTHSTRRFLVVCSYHPEMLTVRASFLVPGKGGSAAPVENSPEWQKISQPSRNARERQFKLVGRNSLVLKEPETPEEEDKDTGVSLLESEGSQYKYPGLDVENSVLEEEESAGNFQRLVNEEEEKFFHRQNRRDGDRLSGVLIAVSLSVIMIGSVVYLLMRESKKQRIAQSQRVIRVVQP